MTKQIFPTVSGDYNKHHNRGLGDLVNPGDIYKER